MSNIGNSRKFLEHLKGKPDLMFLEIGSFKGDSALWLLENILIHDTSTMTCIDTFSGSSEHKSQNIDISNMYNEFITRIQKYLHKVDVIVGESQVVLRRYNHATFDFVYVDGSHRSPDVLEDAILSLRLLKFGGVMIFDDYQWRYFDDDIETPKLGIDAFLSVYQKSIKVLHKNYQVVVEKLS